MLNTRVLTHEYIMDAKIYEIGSEDMPVMRT